MKNKRHSLKKDLFVFSALDLHCCTRAFSSCGKHGILFVVRGLLSGFSWGQSTACRLRASVVVVCWLRNCGAWA